MRSFALLLVGASLLSALACGEEFTESSDDSSQAGAGGEDAEGGTGPGASGGEGGNAGESQGGSSTGGRGGSSGSNTGGQAGEAGDGSGGSATGGMSGAGGTDGGGSGGSGGMSGSGGSGGCEDQRDVVTVPACGRMSGTTAREYSGRVRMTVTGLLRTTPEVENDGFYGVMSNGVDVACPDCFRYNRYSETDCLCGAECPASSHRIVDLMEAGYYPDYVADHTYTVELNLGDASPERLRFGMHDCGCDDNSGTLTVMLDACP